MTTKALPSLTSKLLNKLTIFKSKLKNSIYIITPLRFHSHHLDQMDRLMELKNIRESVNKQNPMKGSKREQEQEQQEQEQLRYEDDVEDACRSFENYLTQMLVEEGELKDLTDVEELLYCWKNLKCPVYVDLVGRFYGELCRDLFSNEAHDV